MNFVALRCTLSKQAMSFTKLILVAKAVSNKKVCYEPRLDRGEGVIQ